MSKPKRFQAQNVFKFITLALGLFAALSFAQTVDAHDGDGDHTHGRREVMTTRAGAKVLPPTTEDGVFHFVVYGDRTGGVPEGLKVLEQAVVDTNLLDPDLVMTVGDLIQGYNESPEWLEQMKEFKAIMNRLKMPWYPVAGNHDVYWRGEGKPPQGHHESNYETHFGPLWYSFRHKDAGFIVLYSDEGDPVTNTKAFNSGKLQTMSEEQLKFVEKALAELKDANNVFVFLHHPRWIGKGYAGGNWDAVHQRLADAGNVSAVFAGHIHQMRYDGAKDGIEYYALATTGGHLSADIPGAGLLHHYNIVTVRKDRISVSTIAVGDVVDPKQFTPELLTDVGLARSIRPVADGMPAKLNVDGSAAGTLKFRLTNPSKRAVELNVSLDSRSLRSGWQSTLDHQHVTLEPGAEEWLEFRLQRAAGNPIGVVMPQLMTQIDYLAESTRIRLPDVKTPIGLSLDRVPAAYFVGQANQYLMVSGESSALIVDAADVNLPDGPFTLEAWVKPDELAGYRGIIAKTESSEYALFSDEGAPTFDIHLGGRYQGAKTNVPMRAGQWTHLAGVYDEQSVTLFVNGKQVQKTPARGKRRRNKLPLIIGADTDPRGQATRAFSGGIDEVRLSKIARYQQNFTPQKRHEPDSDTVLLLHLDRTIGPFTLDHSASATQVVLGEDSRLVPAER